MAVCLRYENAQFIVFLNVYFPTIWKTSRRSEPQPGLMSAEGEGLAAARPRGTAHLGVRYGTVVLHRILRPTEKCDRQEALFHIFCDMHAARVWSRHEVEKTVCIIAKT